LDLTQYRAYDPSVGRWLSRDPIGLAGGPNVYSYVDNDPINEVDPTGLVANPCDPKIPKNKAYIDYIRLHGADATVIANNLDLPPEFILGLSAEESGGSGFQEQSRVVIYAQNYFSLHGNPPKGFHLDPGDVGGGFYRSQQDGYVIVFKDYLDSGMYFANKYKKLIDGQQDATTFATLLHHHGYGVGNERFVPDLVSIIKEMQKRMKCANGGGK
jgi:uncharacterized protein RhaS with RHS repeats